MTYTSIKLDPSILAGFLAVFEDPFAFKENNFNKFDTDRPDQFFITDPTIDLLQLIDPLNEPAPIQVDAEVMQKNIIGSDTRQHTILGFFSMLFDSLSTGKAETDYIEMGNLGFTYSDPDSLEILTLLGTNHRWLEIEAHEMRYHIMHPHLEAHMLLSLGIPSYDFDAAHFRGINLRPVVNHIYYLLKNSASIVENELNSSNHIILKKYNHLELRYKVALTKCLLYLEKHCGETIDWEEVEASYPTYRKVRLFEKEDTDDVSFKETALPALVLSAFRAFSTLYSDPFFQLNK